MGNLVLQIMGKTLKNYHNIFILFTFPVYVHTLLSIIVNRLVAELSKKGTRGT